MSAVKPPNQVTPIKSSPGVGLLLLLPMISGRAQPAVPVRVQETPPLFREWVPAKVIVNFPREAVAVFWGIGASLRSRKFSSPIAFTSFSERRRLSVTVNSPLTMS